MCEAPVTTAGHLLDQWRPASSYGNGTRSNYGGKNCTNTTELRDVRLRLRIAFQCMHISVGHPSCTVSLPAMVWL
jgi:hypothetical protein